MARRLLVGAIVAALMLVGLAPVAGAATPTALLVPQATAFAVLGRSCGGIQEQAFTTGFDSSGYPTGDVYLQTRCGGSGRGGGYKTTTYSKWLAATWDFTGTLVAYTVVAVAPPGLDPAFSATDASGNTVSNALSAINVLPAACTVGNTSYCTYRAYLDLSPTFVPAPRLASISSSSGPAAGGTSVTISGTGFSGASAVSFGGLSAADFVVNTDTSITATSPPSTAGTVDVTVTNAGGTSALSAGDQFTFVAAPAVSGLSPSSGPIGGGTTVEITGANFTGATDVAFGGIAAGFTVNDDSSITAVSPTAEAGDTVDVTVTTVGGTSATSPAGRFAYVAVPAPLVTKVSPATGAAGGNTKVTVTGHNLLGATDVEFGGVPALSFTVNAAGTAITAISPPELGIGPQLVDVTVTGPGGVSPVTLADGFTYVAPVLTKITHASGSAGGGTKVTVAGKNLLGTTEVDFGGVPALSFTVNATGTVITATTPPEVGTGVQAVDVDVTTAAGTGTLPGAFTYAAPVITKIAPVSGPSAGGTKVVITGTNLLGVTDVTFGSTAAVIVKVTATSITVVAPPGVGVVDISVTTAAGTVTLAASFTYL